MPYPVACSMHSRIAGSIGDFHRALWNRLAGTPQPRSRRCVFRSCTPRGAWSQCNPVRRSAPCPGGNPSPPIPSTERTHFRRTDDVVAARGASPTMNAGFLADLAELYPDLDASFLREAHEGFELVHVAGGEVLVRHGEPSDSLYILMRGRLVATRQDAGGHPVRLGEIGRGEIIGEMSVLTGGTRTATVTGLRDSQ